MDECPRWTSCPVGSFPPSLENITPNTNQHSPYSVDRWALSAAPVARLQPRAAGRRES